MRILLSFLQILSVLAVTLHEASWNTYRFSSFNNLSSKCIGKSIFCCRVNQLPESETFIFKGFLSWFTFRQKCLFLHFWRLINKIQELHAYYGSSCKITAETDKISGNESKIRIGMSNLWMFSMNFFNLLIFAHFPAILVWHIKMWVFHTESLHIKMYQTHWSFATCLDFQWCFLVCEISSYSL